ncbi:hypothetical protein PQQ72_15735 [Paraburkholderia strydomiana]|uniref:hypothetical protein n=1 Tax=Paraburkholderia strydomiana TaxID=1245417 RepID=UPI0038BA1C44
MPPSDHPPNQPLPADLSQGFSLWNVVVSISQAHETIREGHEAIIDMMLGKLESLDNALALIAKQWELILGAMQVAADGERILEDYRDEIAALAIRLGPSPVTTYFGSLESDCKHRQSSPRVES